MGMENVADIWMKIMFANVIGYNKFIQDQKLNIRQLKHNVVQNILIFIHALMLMKKRKNFN